MATTFERPVLSIAKEIRHITGIDRDLVNSFRNTETFFAVNHSRNKES